MYLDDHITLFKKNRTADVLRVILNEHGPKGFSLACKSAGISRGAGKRMLGIYNDAGSISQIARNACGCAITKVYR